MIRMGDSVQPLLVLDLDGTILDTAKCGVNSEPPDFTSASDGDGNAETETFIRPGFAEFWPTVQQHGYQLAVWTAAPSTYAAAMIDGLDRASPGFRAALCGRIFTDELTSCSFERGRVIRTKELQRLVEHTGVPLHRCLIVDDTPDTYALNVRNALPVETFEAGYGDDDTLVELAAFLCQLEVSSSAILDVSGWKLAPASGTGPLTVEAVEEQTTRARRASMAAGPRGGPPQPAWVGRGSVVRSESSELGIESPGN